MNYKNVFDAAPGSDDDGGGTVTILGASRGQHLSLFLIAFEHSLSCSGILASGYLPETPLKFH
jgi:hypothetical protein